MGCKTCLSVFLILLDILYGITGLAVLALGIAWFFKDRILSVFGWTSDTIKSLLNGTGGTIELSQVLQIAAIVFLVVGSVIIVTAIMACVATATKNSVMFALFLIPLFLIMLLNFAIGALIYMEANQYLGTEDTVKNNMLKQLKGDDYYINGSYTALGKMWNVLQTSDLTTSNYSCCGIYGPNDYVNSKFRQNNAPNKVPYSCCRLQGAYVEEPTISMVVNYPQCNQAASSTEADQNYDDPTDNLAQQGCVNHSFYQFVYTTIAVGIGIFFGWGGLEFLIFIIGTLVCCMERSEKGYM